MNERASHDGSSIRERRTSSTGAGAPMLFFLVSTSVIAACVGTARSDEALDACKRIQIGMSLDDVRNIMPVDVKLGENLFQVAHFPCQATIVPEIGVRDLHIFEKLKNTKMTEALFETYLDRDKSIFGDPKSMSYNMAPGHPVYGGAAWSCKDPFRSIYYGISLNQEENDVFVFISKSYIKHKC